MKLVRSGMLVKKKVGIGVRGAVAHSPRLDHPADGLCRPANALELLGDKVSRP